MNWEAAGAIGEIVGAFAVVGTIAYLATQIRDGRREAQVTAAETVMSNWNAAIQALGQSPEVSSIIQRGLANYHTLEQPEKFVFHSRMDNMMIQYYTALTYKGERFWELPDEVETALLRFISSPGGLEWWHDAGHVYPHYDHVNKLLKERLNDLVPFSETSFLSAEPIQRCRDDA